MSIETGIQLPSPSLRIGAQVITDGESTHEHIDPATGKANGLVPMASTGQIDQAVQAAHAAFIEWRALPAGQRSRQLMKLAELMEANTELLVAAGMADNGAPRITAGNMVT